MKLRKRQNRVGGSKEREGMKEAQTGLYLQELSPTANNYLFPYGVWWLPAYLRRAVIATIPAASRLNTK